MFSKTIWGCPPLVTALIVATLFFSGVAEAKTNNYPWGYCTWYAVQCFNTYAPEPGCNWSANAQDFVRAADAKGWQTTTDLHGATRGAIPVWSGGLYGHTASVTAVYSWGISLSEMNFGPKWIDYANGKTNYFGIVTTANLTWAQVAQRTTTLKFVGYVLPSLKASPAPTPPPAPTPLCPVPLYRYYLPLCGDHFYSTDFNELGYGRYGYIYEGIQCYISSTQAPGTTALYRYYNDGNGQHFYSSDFNELGNGNYGYHLERVQGYVYPGDQRLCLTNGYNISPMFRYYNPFSGGHFFTTNWNELGYGAWCWNYEGIHFSVLTR